MSDKQNEKVSAIRAQELYTSMIGKLNQAGLKSEWKINPSLRFSNSFTFAGQCRYQRETHTCLISLSKNFMENEQAVKDTLAHELVHTMHNCRNHGRNFHVYARKIEKILGDVEIQVRASQEDMDMEALKRRAKYLVRCQSCGHEWYRQRRSKLILHPERYHCGCGGRLDVFLLR